MFIWTQFIYQLPVGLLAQLVERCTGIAEVMGSYPVRAWNFFQVLFTATRFSSVLSCEDLLISYFYLLCLSRPRPQLFEGWIRLSVGSLSLRWKALHDFVNPYPLDSVIHSLSNWALEEYTWVPANCHRNLGGRGGWWLRIDCYPIHGQQQYSKPLRGWKAAISSGWMGHLERVQLFLKWSICIVSMMWCSLPLIDCHSLTQCKKCRYCKYCIVCRVS